jgi:hypothetical protein
MSKKTTKKSETLSSHDLKQLSQRELARVIGGEQATLNKMPKPTPITSDPNLPQPPPPGR